MVVLIVIFFFAVLNLYLAARYSHVNRGLRLPGWLISVFTRYDSVDGLRRFAAMANRLMPLLFDWKSWKLDAQRIMIPGQDGHGIPVVLYREKQTTGNESEKPQKKTLAAAGSKKAGLKDDTRQDLADSRPGAVGFLWIHGGGYAIGTPGGEKRFLAPYVLQTNTIAVVPDYRLSPAAPYPAAFEDCRDTLLWMKEHAAELGIDENRLFVGGASAGGGLTAALALYARDSGKVNLAFHMPIYPMINDKMDTVSMIGNTGMLWDEKRNRAAWKVYLDTLYGTDDVPKYAAPARETDLSGLPPCYTFVGTLDPFYDETLQYVQRLISCGGKARCDIYEAAFHGFDVIPCRLSTAARAKLLEEYKYAVKHYAAPLKSNGKIII